MKPIKTALEILMIITLFFIAMAVVLTSQNILNKVKFYVVQTGSMKPAVPAGSLIIIKQEEYKTGDIITFRASQEAQTVTTHRIIRVSEDGFITKGDANDIFDTSPVSKNSIIGKVIVTIPLLGFLIAFSKTQLGFITLIIVPALIIILSEIINLKKALTEIKINKNNFEKIHLGRYCLLILPLMGLFTSYIYLSNSYLSSKALISTNSLNIKIPPQVELFLADDKKTITFNINFISDFKKISYELTYDSDSGKQGVLGKADLTGENEFTRTITLGTCSTGGTCVYHSGITNIHLHVDLEDKDGNITSLDNSL